MPRRYLPQQCRNHVAKTAGGPGEVSPVPADPFFEQGRSTAGRATDYPAATREALAGFSGRETRTISSLPERHRCPEPAHPRFCKKKSPPFHAITTELEHNSVLRPLSALEREGRLSLSIVPFHDAHICLQDIKNAILPDTRLLVMTHGSNVLGSVQDIRPLRNTVRQTIFFLSLTAPRPPGSSLLISRISRAAPLSSPGTRRFSVSPDGRVLPERP